MKLDITKAFDFMNWQFVLNILEALDSPLLFIGWIRVCLTTPKFSLKINENLEGFFSVERGLRLGDPLSPCLFVLCIEVLTQLLNGAARLGEIKYHPGCSKLGLTHLSFVDDLMIFIDASTTSLQGIKTVLQKYYQMSGLKVSYDKSEFHCCGISEDERRRLAEIIGIRNGMLPARYLGVPLISEKLKEAYYKALVEKITARVKPWTVKFLSIAGRLQLISSILTRIYNHCCNISLLPKKVIKEVERICNSFPWKGEVRKAVRVKLAGN